MAVKMSPQMRRMVQARTALLLDQPFFGVLALHLELVEDPTCQTAWTDGKRLGFSPAFVDKQTQDQLVGLTAHEVLHPACGHNWRRDAREARKWNAAADYAINPILTEAGFALPDGGLNDPQYAGKSSEWIFDRLPDGTDGGDGCRDAEGDGPSEADWQQAKEQAINSAAAQGKLPESLRRLIGDATKAKVDWRSLLRRYIQDVCKSDYSWRRPNRRYIGSGLYLPVLHAETVGRIAVAVDTSGSVDDVLLAQFAGEIQAICAEVQPAAVEVIYCDAAVNHTDTYERGETPDITPHGGGGTAFAPVFEHVDAQDEQPIVVVYLTDLCGSFPDVAPDYPVIWCVTGGATGAPFGDVVPCD